jgi:hypothetical protein
MKRLCLILAVLVLAQPMYAQSVREIEDSTLSYLTKLQKHSNNFGDAQEDSLAKCNASLQNYLQVVLCKQPLSLPANFSRLVGSGLIIASSKDKKFRIYSWNTQDGGTMQGFNSIFQFQSGKIVCAKILYFDTFIDGQWTGPGYFYPNVYSIISKNGKTFYLAIRKGIYSSAVHSVGVQCFAIENGLINDSVKIFKTKNEYLNNIDVSVDYTDIKKMTKEPDIYFSSDNTKMYIPLIGNDMYKGKYLVYKFDGTNYVFDQNTK